MKKLVRFLKQSLFDGKDLRAFTVLDGEIETIPVRYAAFLYLEIYKKLFEILKVAYSDYEGLPPEFYVSPHSELNFQFKQLSLAFRKIEAKYEWQMIPVDDFNVFPDLYGDHRKRKELFTDISRDHQMCTARILKELKPKQYFLTYELEENFKFIDELLEDLKNRKQEALGTLPKLSVGDLSYKHSTAELSFKGKSITISSSIAEIKFLLLLLEKKQSLATYEEIAETVGRENTPETAHRLKTDLKKVLREKGFSAQKIEVINDMIHTVRGRGYILKPE